MSETNIPKELADKIKNSTIAGEMLARLANENEESFTIKCFSCGESISTKQSDLIVCPKCETKLTELAISSRQEIRNRDGTYSKIQILKTDPKTKKSYTVSETPKIINQSAVFPRLPEIIKQILILKRESMREIAKMRDPKSVVPNETKTQILTDMKGACEAWTHIFSLYIGSERSEFRTEFLNEIYSIAEFVNGKYKTLVTAVKDLMDTLIFLGEVDEGYFVNYKKYFDEAISSEDEKGILSANRVIAYATYYLQSSRSTVVTRRISRSIG